MINLDNISDATTLDNGFVYDSIKFFPSQIKQAWNEVKNLKSNIKSKNIDNVVISGMGGSALGGRIFDSLTSQLINLPVEVFTEYHIPNYVSNKTLVVISSYSGNTHETISDLYEAQKRNAKIYVISTSGKISDIARKDKLSFYEINPIYNPSKQPRMALGYSISAIFSFLAKLGFLNISDSIIEKIISDLEDLTDFYGIKNPSDKNPAKNLALKFYQKFPVIISSEHLVGSAHSFKNQLNETAKTFSAMFEIPELNHHLMEGLKHPVKLKEIIKFLFIESDLYTKQVLKRYPITKDVIEKNGISHATFNPMLKDKLSQGFEVMFVGMFISYYLSMLYQENPVEIPWVDYFKKNLGN